VSKHLRRSEGWRIMQEKAGEIWSAAALAAVRNPQDPFSQRKELRRRQATALQIVLGRQRVLNHSIPLCTSINFIAGSLTNTFA
jgi:hypothetical protein